MKNRKINLLIQLGDKLNKLNNRLDNCEGKLHNSIGFINETNYNYEKALENYLKVAEKNDVDAIMSCAEMYKYGKGTEINLDKSREYYFRAANLGNINAINKVLKTSTPYYKLTRYDRGYLLFRNVKKFNGICYTLKLSLFNIHLKKFYKSYVFNFILFIKN